MAAERPQVHAEAAPARPAEAGLSIPAPLGGLFAFGFVLGLIVLVHYAVSALFLAVILLVEWLS